MVRSKMTAALLGATLLGACGGEPGEEARSPVRVFHGARVITGDGTPPVEDAVIVVRNGLIAAIGPCGAVEEPQDAETVDLTGATVMPTLVNVHGHVGYLRGAETSSEQYSRENVLDHLRRSMYYGVGVVQSLGTDRDGTEIAIRDEQRAGLLVDPDLALLFTAGPGVVAPTPGAPNGGPFFATDVVLEAATPEEARLHVRGLAEADPDIVKLWVDDRNGTRRKLTPEVYRAVIAQAHELGLRAVAHVYYLDDAKDLVRAGVDGFAHMVRAEPGVDEELVSLIRDRGVFQCSTMTIQKRLVDPPTWVDDPVLAETVTPDVIAEWRAAIEGATPEAVERARTAYERLERSLRRLHAGGVRLVLCGDTGLSSQAPGFTEHRELEALVQAGLPPLEAIRAATAAGAEVLGLTDRGTLAPSKRADFIVLGSDPLEDIANTRRIDAVYRGGVAIDRESLRASWSGGGGAR